MPIICRLISVADEDVERLKSAPGDLAAYVANAKFYTDVYRYWHAIDHLLRRHGAASTILDDGTPIGAASDGVPASRLFDADQVRRLDTALSAFAPEVLATAYDPADLDGADVYPAQWTAWEEEFDPLGEILEHYTFLQYFAAERAKHGDALLFHFVFKRDETDD